MAKRWLAFGHAAPDRAAGQGLTEYALVLLLMGVAAVVALQVLGTALSAVISQVAATLP